MFFFWSSGGVTKKWNWWWTPLTQFSHHYFHTFPRVSAHLLSSFAYFVLLFIFCLLFVYQALEAPAKASIPAWPIRLGAVPMHRCTKVIKIFVYHFFVYFSLLSLLFTLHFRCSDDYYYGGSMRDLSNRHGNRRKSSSASHIGKLQTGFKKFG